MHRKRWAPEHTHNLLYVDYPRGLPIGLIYFKIGAVDDKDSLFYNFGKTSMLQCWSNAALKIRVNFIVELAIVTIDV